MQALRLDQSAFLALAEDLLAQCGEFEFQAHGGSMYPAIQAGDIVRVCLASADDLLVGSVVLYRDRRDRAVVHRIVRVLYPMYLIRGDASRCGTERVSADQVLGVVTGVQRGAGKFEPVTGRMLPTARMRVWSALVRCIHPGR